MYIVGAKLKYVTTLSRKNSFLYNPSVVVKQTRLKRWGCWGIKLAVVNIHDNEQI